MKTSIHDSLYLSIFLALSFSLEISFVKNSKTQQQSSQFVTLLSTYHPCHGLSGRGSPYWQSVRGGWRSVGTDDFHAHRGRGKAATEGRDVLSY